MTEKYAVMRVAIHDDKGSILRVVSCSPTQLGEQALDDEFALEVAIDVADDTHYIKGGQAVEKAALSPSVELDGFTATITGLPAGLKVEFDGVTATTDDEPLEIEVDEPGTYKLRIDGGAPYISTTVEITFG